MTACYEKLQPEILEQWQAGNKAATTVFLTGLAKQKPAKQLQSWQDRLDLQQVADDVLDGVDEDDKPAKKKAKKS